MKYLNGYVMDFSSYPCRRVPAHVVCEKSGVCTCGFCKGAGMCDFGDCHNMLPTTGTVGTLCVECSASEWKGRMPGHRASIPA